MIETLTISSNIPEALAAIAESKNPDAALLYAMAAASGGRIVLGQVTDRLDWDELRVEKAANILLLCKAAVLPPPPLSPVLPPEEMLRSKRKDPAFEGLCSFYESTQGRILRRSELETLLSIYQQLNLPPEVLMLLIGYCKSKGMLSARELEKQAYGWHDQGILTYDAAERHLQELKDMRRRSSHVLRMFGVFDRKASPSEEKYIASWAQLNISEELLQLAYDRTVLRTGKLQWGYLNKILLSWHEQGIRNAQQAEKQDTGPEQAPKSGNDSVTTRVRRQFEEKRRRREQEMERRLGALRRASPAFAENERQLRMLASQAARAAIGGQDVRQAQKENARLLDERARILTQLGHEPAWLEDRPDCPICGDRGYIGSEMCKCFIEACRNEAEAVHAGK